MKQKLEFGQQNGIRRDNKPKPILSKEEAHQAKVMKQQEKSRFESFLNKRKNMMENRKPIVPANLKTVER
jgi:hypothetical protein